MGFREWPYWLKGALFAFLGFMVLFFIVSFIWSQNEIKDLPKDYGIKPTTHMCSDIFGSYSCYFGEFFLSTLIQSIIFGIPVAIIGLIIGWRVGKKRIENNSKTP